MTFASRTRTRSQHKSTQKIQYSIFKDTFNVLFTLDSALELNNSASHLGYLVVVKFSNLVSWHLASLIWFYIICLFTHLFSNTIKINIKILSDAINRKTLSGDNLWKHENLNKIVRTHTELHLIDTSEWQNSIDYLIPIEYI